jgi:two-component system, OmpR family, phosphate regulon sensor histidine kinase PhoR
LFRSIFWKITIPITLLFVIGMGILGFYLVGSISTIQITNLRISKLNEARLIAEDSIPLLIKQGGREELAAMARTLGREIDSRVTIIARDGTVLGDSEEDPLTMENHVSRPEVQDALTKGIGESTRFSGTTRQNTMYIAVPISNNNQVIGIARVAIALTAIENSLKNTTATIVWTIVIITIIVILIVGLITRMIIRPVRELTNAAREISGGKVDRQIKIRSNDEIGQLGYAFNRMSTNLKKMMDTITGESNKLSTVLANLTDGVIMADPAGRIVLANPAAGKLFGFIPDRANNKSLIEIIQDYRISDALKECLKTSRTQSVQLDSTTGRFLRAIAIPLAVGEFNGALLLFQDLTEMKNLQTMRRELIGNVSHELRTPLASVKAIVETLQDGAIDDDKVSREFLEKVENEVDRMSQIVTELTDLSRIETGGAKLNLEPANLNSLVADVVVHLSPQAERKGLNLAVAPAPDALITLIDKDRIRQVIINIVHNAIKFTPSGGRITISTSMNGDSVVTKISDTGVGISKEDLPHIFERFFKADRSRSGTGTGLGLAIAKHIIQAHGGSIEAQSEEGKGTTFTISIPVQPGLTK